LPPGNGVESAKAFANRLDKCGSDLQGKVRQAFSLAFQRAPDVQEELGVNDGDVVS
jgi:hypothetical protein